VEAVLNRDLFVVENGLLLVILMAFTVVALSDLVALLVNPQARYSTQR
jgi:ABC-type dipeptide/oligopeptide/nickel transport system permease component